MKISALTRTYYTFEGKKSYENVLALLYRHWMTLALKAFYFIFLAVMPFALWVLAGDYISGWELTDLFWFLVAVYFLFWWRSLFYASAMYLLDTWIVTDHRIIDSTQKGFFNRTVSERSLAKIQDITVHIKGFIPTLLDFGDLEVQTAGTEQKFIFQQMPHPSKTKDLIMQAHRDFVIQHKDGIEIHERAAI